MISEKADKMTDFLVGACVAYGRSNSQEMHAKIGEAITQLHTYIAELEELQRWRVVADGEMPEKNGWYWAHDDQGGESKALFYGGEWSKFTQLSDITHWMPLPKSPEERER